MHPQKQKCSIISYMTKLMTLCNILPMYPNILLCNAYRHMCQDSADLANSTLPRERDFLKEQIMHFTFSDKCMADFFSQATYIALY